MAKSLVIINEPFDKMMLGKNTTLSYILACFERGDEEVYILNSEELDANNKLFSPDKNTAIKTILLKPQEGQALAAKYKEINTKIMTEALNEDWEALSRIENFPVSEILQNLEIATTSAAKFDPKVDLVINRIEPMKLPFPPKGKKNVIEAMQELSEYFSGFTMNLPIATVNGKLSELGDKETPQILNKMLKALNQPAIATETAEFKLDDGGFAEAIKSMKEKYNELYQPNQGAKVVLKPKNSAQSLGVFALEFTKETDESLSLEKIKNISFQELARPQIYKIQEGVSETDLKEIIEILCCAQRLRDDQEKMAEHGDKTAESCPPNFVKNLAKDLYNEEVLAQPFLEGVRSGDIRANVIRNSDGELALAGCTFRNKTKLEGFVIGFSNDRDALNLETLKTKSVKDLKCDLYETGSIAAKDFRICPLYNISSNVEEAELSEIINILCYVQSVKSDERKLEELQSQPLSQAQDAINEVAQTIHNSQFTKPSESPESSIIRIVRDNNKKFCIDNVADKNTIKKSSIKEGSESDQVTTCYTTGAAISKPLFILSPQIIDSINEKMTQALEYLNNNSELKEQYANVTELGFDLIIIDKNGERGVLIGEINHFCPAILPISEALKTATEIREKKLNENSEEYQNLIEGYSGGLGFAKEALNNNFALQLKKGEEKTPSTRPESPTIGDVLSQECCCRVS